MSVNRPIILIDDDPDDLEIYVECLKDLQEENLICFTNGQKALNYLTTTDDVPFIIFCDINLPGISGTKVLKILGETPALKEKTIPFIFLSTTADEDSIKRAYQNTVQGFFMKPASYKELNELLKGILWYWRKCRYPND